MKNQDMIILIGIIAVAAFVLPMGLFSVFSGTFGQIKLSGADIELTDRMFENEVQTAKFTFNSWELASPELSKVQKLSQLETPNDLYFPIDKTYYSLAWFVDGKFKTFVYDTGIREQCTGNSNDYPPQVCSNIPFTNNLEVLPSKSLRFLNLDNISYVVDATEVGVGQHNIELKALYYDIMDCGFYVKERSCGVLNLNQSACPIYNKTTTPFRVEPYCKSPYFQVVDRSYAKTLEQFSPQFKTIAGQNFTVYAIDKPPEPSPAPQPNPEPNPEPSPTPETQSQYIAIVIGLVAIVAAFFILRR